MQLTGAHTATITPLLGHLLGNTMLLVEPDVHLLPVRRRLLARAEYTVRAVCTAGQVFELDGEDAPHIVLLSDGVGEFQLNALAEYVRRRWRHARILIVGEATPALEDHLYDETVARGAGAEEFLAAVEKCVREQF